MKKLLGICLLLLSLSCAKEETLIPDVPVNFSAPLTDPRLTGLSAGKAITIPGYGVAGIILYYRTTDNSYVAYDRCSTVNPEQKNAVVVDESGLAATDPVSGAKYSLLDGSPAKAPAKTSLKQYGVTKAGNVIQVTN